MKESPHTLSMYYETPLSLFITEGSVYIIYKCIAGSKFDFSVSLKILNCAGQLGFQLHEMISCSHKQEHVVFDVQFCVFRFWFFF